MILPLYAALEQLDMSLIDAAKDLGASPRHAFWHITLPLSLPGILAGSMLVFIPTVGAFLTPDLLGGGMVNYIGNVIERQFKSSRDFPFGFRTLIDVDGYSYCRYSPIFSSIAG